MARGLPDWWYAMVPAKVIFGKGQTSWYIAEEADIAGASFADLCEYKVPAGYILTIGFGAVSCSGPGIQKCSWLVEGVLIGPSYYEVVKHSTLPDTSLYQVPAGITIGLRLYNLDSVELTFDGGIMGYEEVRTP